MADSKVAFVIVAFVGIIVGLTLLLKAVGFIGIMTDTDVIANQSITFPANDSTTKLELRGQDIVGTATVINATGGQIVTSPNYSITQCLGSDGQIATCLYSTGTWNAQPANITYEYEPDGYVTSAAGRAMAGLIIVFSCLAIALVAFPDLRGIFGS